MNPVLDVSGMTEFKISDKLTLGLMPSSGIVRLLGDSIINPDKAKNIPRCELYLKVKDIKNEYNRAIKDCHAKPISAPSLRNWGDVVGYFSDPDGHIIAFAE